MGKKNKSLQPKSSQTHQAAFSKANVNDKIENLNVKTDHENQPSAISHSEDKNPQTANQSKQKKPIKKQQKSSKQPLTKTKQPAKQAPSQLPQVKGKPWTQLQYQLRGQIVESLKKCNFRTMLPVQQASIPLLLKNFDLAVQAQTGSGKTLSFLIPLLEKYLAINLTAGQKKIESAEVQDGKEFRPLIRYLIISPTRQLCQQTFNVLTKLLTNLPSKQRSQQYLSYCHCATGGSDMTTDIEKLKESTVVFVGTIGRIRELSEHMDQNWLKKVDYLFIDEADRVLKQKGIQHLIRSVQKVRRTAMFSATLQALNQKNYEFYGMRNLAKISLKQTVPNNTSNSNHLQPNDDKKYIIPKSLTNTYVKLSSRIEKMQFLTNFLKNHIESQKIIVFFNTCASVDYYTKLFNAYFNFKEEDEQIVGLHGRLKTNRREKLIKQFLKKQSGCLFATDVVSRGIDFDHIHFIVQVDPPEDPDNYVHRIGRTARINRPGTAILLIEEHEDAFINYLAEKSVGVQEVVDVKSHYVKDEDLLTIQSIKDKMDQIMRTDRDFVEKSKKAFVSYIRSYKEHELRYIFEFKNLNIGRTAQSFFMYRIPRIKQILGKAISFTQSTIDIEAIPWLDKNQELQFMRKKDKREEELIEKKKLEKKILKNADAKNNKSKRKRIKAQRESKFLTTLNKEHRDILKTKTAGSRASKNQQSDSENDDNNNHYEDEDTGQIEQRFADKDEENKKNGGKNQQAQKSKRGRRNK